jgi:hypothetical protein
MSVALFISVQELYCLLRLKLLWKPASVRGAEMPMTLLLGSLPAEIYTAIQNLRVKVC